MSPVPQTEGRFIRADAPQRELVPFLLDGRPAQAVAGDTLLTAVLCQQGSLRAFEFAPERRAGFCLIGACQDCWVRLSSGRAVRACTTAVEPGMQVVTR